MMLVRRPFGPRPGFVWYASDYQQIEARIFADEAEEEFMIAAFKAGRDVYQEFADVIEREAGVDIGRQIAKNIFLGKLYGLGIKKLIKTIMDVSASDVDEDSAARVLEVFDSTFPGVSGFMQDTIRSAKANGYVVNRYGQRIDVWRDEAYKGVNYIIQSSAARLMKRGMVKCHKYLESIGYGWLVMSIHDELIFEFPADHRPRSVIRKLAALMSENDGMFPHVETSVDVKKVVGNWLDSVPCEWATAN
jgi:DNA polymerase-1